MADFDAPLLDLARVQETVERLSLRIHERFPESGLSSVASSLHEVALETDEVLAWIERPNLPLRLSVGLVITLLLALLWAGLNALDFGNEEYLLTDILAGIEAATNEMILIGAAILFLVGIETRAKRRRVIHSINRLRAIAHVIDAHQLTKDPKTVATATRTEHSPTRDLSTEQLSRYLDYCSELLAMTAKLGFLYVQRFDDSEANHVVNELETLTTGLSRKIWQKLMILESRQHSPTS